MKRAHGVRPTPAYDAWMAAQRRAVEAERLLRESRVRIGRRKGRMPADADAAARAAQLEREAAALFAQAMEEMESAVQAALDEAHARLH